MSNLDLEQATLRMMKEANSVREFLEIKAHYDRMVQSGGR